MDYSSVEFGTLAEQVDETHYDNRIDADDDLEKGRIKFPSTRERLYGREPQLQQLSEIYHAVQQPAALLVETTQGRSQEDEATREEVSTPEQALAQVAKAGSSNEPQNPLLPGRTRSSTSRMSHVVFLAGYSGTGKSTLVDAFVHELYQHEKSKTGGGDERLCLDYLWGKFACSLQVTVPFSALSQALNQWVLHLLTHSGPAVKPSNNHHHPCHRHAWIRAFVQSLAALDIYPGSSYATVLEQTLIPALPRLLQRFAAAPATTTLRPVDSSPTTSTNTTRTGSTTNATTINGTLIQYTVQKFMRALTTTTTSGSPRNRTATPLPPPVIFFLDDLQWADKASLQLLSALLLDKALYNILFLLAYRPNEMGPHQEEFVTLVQQLQEARSHNKYNDNKDSDKDSHTTANSDDDDDTEPAQEKKEDAARVDTASEGASNVNKTLSEVCQAVASASAASHGIHFMELFNLSPDSIAEFIADSIDKTPEDVTLVADAIYQKTLGNIFFVKQAMEELVRKNALYYDMVMFEWQFGNVSRVELEQFLSEDVLEMVQSKIQTVPRTLQKALVLAAYTSQTTIELSLLQALLQTDVTVDRRETTLEALLVLMNRAFVEGLMLRCHHPHNHHAPNSNGRNPRNTNNDSLQSSHPTLNLTESSSSSFFPMDDASRLMANAGKNQSHPPDRSTSPQGVPSIRYQFTHDRIREAACATVLEGPERDKMLLRISKVLLAKAVHVGTENETSRVDLLPDDAHVDDHCSDWMLFTAARHLNSLPDKFTNDMQLPHLNLRVAKLAVYKGAFNEARIFLEEGIKRLDENCWDSDYNLCLELKVTLAETDRKLGHNEKVVELAEEIFENAKSLLDKSRIHSSYIEATNSKNDNNYVKSVDVALGILKLYNVDVPSAPNKGTVKREKMQLRLALRGRSMLCLTKFPVSHDALQIAQMKVAWLTVLYALLGQRTNLAVLVGYRMFRVVLTNKTITKDLPSMLEILGGQSRENGKYESAFMFANMAIGLLDRFPEEKGLEFLRARVGLYSSLFCLRLPFRDCVEPFLDLSKLGYAQGETEYGLGAAMLAMFSFMIASLPLNALFEPKLLLFEEMALHRGRKNFTIIFRLIRQYLYNLQGGSKASPVPTQVNGEAFDEFNALAMLDGPVRKQNIRDISMIRLELAVLFDEQATMERMLERLDEYPIHDLLTVRQHLRMTYIGLASMILCSRKPNRRGSISNQSSGATKADKWAKLSLKYFEEFSRFGSPNAQPVHACLKALNKPSVSAFDEAIDACANAGLLNLTAIMNERCGIMLFQNPGLNPTTNGEKTRSAKSSIRAAEQATTSSSQTGPLHETYLKCALWLYHDWGAKGKVVDMQSRFEFLQNVMKEKPPSQLSSVRRRAVKCGIPRLATTSTIVTAATSY